MPDKKIALLIRALQQGGWEFSPRASKNEFNELTKEEAAEYGRKIQEVSNISVNEALTL